MACYWSKIQIVMASLENDESDADHDYHAHYNPV